MAIGFFVVALFDRVWLKIFKIKTPESPTKVVNSSRSLDICGIDEMRVRLTRANDATFPGSPAWFAQQHFNSRK